MDAPEPLDIRNLSPDVPVLPCVFKMIPEEWRNVVQFLTRSGTNTAAKNGLFHAE